MLTRREWIGGAAATGLLAPLAARAQEDGPVTVPVTMRDEGATVTLTIGGSGPLLFALDSGGVTGLIDRNVAHALRLRSAGMLRLGVASTSEPNDVFAARDVVVGGTFRQPLVTLAAAPPGVLGDGISGSLDAGFLSRVANVLSFDSGTWRFWSGALPSLPGFTAVPPGIAPSNVRGGSDFLFADTRLDGRPLRLALDTGFPGSVRLTPAAARRVGLAGGDRNTAPARERAGRVEFVTRADMLTIGPERFPKPLVLLADVMPSDRTFADGSIGIDLLRQLDLATDPGSRRLLIRRATLPTPPPRYSRSGLWVDRDGDAARVRAVGRGSPAAVQGIAIGDRIVGVPYDTLLKELDEPAGTTVPLTVTRGATARAVQLTLADYV